MLSRSLLLLSVFSLGSLADNSTTTDAPGGSTAAASSAPMSSTGAASGGGGSTAGPSGTPSTAAAGGGGGTQAAASNGTATPAATESETGTTMEITLSTTWTFNGTAPTGAQLFGDSSFKGEEEKNFKAALMAAGANPVRVELVHVTVSSSRRQLAVRELAMMSAVVSSEFEAEYATAALANLAVTASAETTFITKYNADSKTSKDNNLIGSFFVGATSVPATVTTAASVETAPAAMSGATKMGLSAGIFAGVLSFMMI